MESGLYDWFEPLYAEADNATQIPWALPEATPYLTQWLKENSVNGSGRSAVVVGCGLGNDAEALAAAGFSVTAFDVSKSAIAWAKKRFPNSSVSYVVADLFDMPAEWKGSFDIAFEFRTIQALPISMREAAIAQICLLPKAGATLLLATYTRATNAIPDGPPWPLSEEELAQFEEEGLNPVKKERFYSKESRFSDRILIEYLKLL